MVGITVGRMRNSESKSRAKRKRVEDNVSASLASSSF